MVQLGWRFLVFPKDSALSQGYGLGGKSGVKDAEPRSAELLQWLRSSVSTRVAFSSGEKQN